MSTKYIRRYCLNIIYIGIPIDSLHKLINYLFLHIGCEFIYMHIHKNLPAVELSNVFR